VSTGEGKPQAEAANAGVRMFDKYPVSCWYASQLGAAPRLSFFFRVRGFYSPAPSWFSLNSSRYGLNQLSTMGGLFSLVGFLLVAYPSGLRLASCSPLPTTSTYSTVTRGPMVRKKQSREQVGYSRRQGLLTFALANPLTATYLGFENTITALYTTLWAHLRPYFFSFSFLFFQQTLVSLFSPLV
jgi:hypothetical protein